MSKYLITGGAGFIGSNIAEELVRQGENVRVLDNFSTGLHSNLACVEDNIEIIDGDLRDPETLQLAVHGVDYVLHQGALPSVPRSIEAPFTSNAVNVDGTLNLLIAARHAGVKRLVMASSSSVYGDTPTLPKREDMMLSPLSPYGVSKLAAEQYCMAFYASYGFETVALRYFNVFGPRQNPMSQYAAVIPLFIMSAHTGTQPTIYGTGEQSRDFTYVDNVVEANILAATKPKAAGKIFNIAAGGTNTLLNVLALISSLHGEQLIPKHEPQRTGDIMYSYADISRAQEILDFKVKIGFEEGLAKTYSWFKQNCKQQECC
ncbi:SDR family oxidoreductase [bacterium]|nr:SDR family oxidoreductase [bacterium]